MFQIRSIHKLITQKDDFIITYSWNSDLLPINNNDNFHKAVQCSYQQSIMRVFIHRKSQFFTSIYSLGRLIRKRFVWKVMLNF